MSSTVCNLLFTLFTNFYAFYEFQSFLKDYFVFLNNIPCPCPSILLTRHTIISLFCLCDLQRGDSLSKVTFLFLCCTRAFIEYWWIYDLWTKRQTNLSNCREAGFFFSFKLWQERMTEHKSNLSGPLSSIWPTIVRIQTLVFSKQISSDTSTTSCRSIVL